MLHGERAVTFFVPVIRTVAKDSLEPFRGDAQLWSHNVRLGIESVLPQLDAARTKLPAVKFDEVLELPNLARALEFTVGRVSARGAVTREQIDERYAKLQTLRVPMLLMAQVFAAPAVGLFDADAVNALVAGSGLYNHAQDGIGLAAMFREHHAAIAGKHPFTAAQLADIESHGVWLSEHVTPEGARPPATDHSMEQQRDALAEVIRRRHEELRLIGIALFGENGVDEKVPKLGSRTVARAASGDGASGTAAPAEPAK